MPELPEVETIKEQLLLAILGKKIVKINVLEKKMFIGDKKKILNQEIFNVVRRGKILRIFFENDYDLIIHFKLNGQIFYQEKDSFIDAKFKRIVLTLDDGSRLVFNDLRKFAWMKVQPREKFESEKFGIEPLTKDFTFSKFKTVILSSDKEIKTLLMDQEKIAGLGNIYTNESLFKAKIYPFKKASDLTPNEIASLHKSIINIIERAIREKGSSGRDNEYRQIDGISGGFQKYFSVYQKTGEKCGVCGSIIKRVKKNGRSTFYCPKCQK